MTEKINSLNIKRIHTFLKSLIEQGGAPLNAVGYKNISRDQYEMSYQSWARGGNGWNALQSGGTYQMAALTWYQHIYRPKSSEWRPAIILRGIINFLDQNNFGVQHLTPTDITKEPSVLSDMEGDKSNG